MNNSNLNYEQILNEITTQFAVLFRDKISNFDYVKAYTSLLIYAAHAKDENSQTPSNLEKFAQDYYNMKRNIVSKRNELIDLISDDNFKYNRIIERIKINHELRHFQQLCKNLNKFDKMFYEKLNISLLRVENERWAREKSKENIQTQSN